MKIAGRPYIFLMASCVLFAGASFSQDAVIKEWPGTLKRDGRQKEGVTFKVKVSGEGPFILGMTYADTPFEFKKQKHGAESLTFDWTPGEEVSSCELRKLDTGDFKGECKSENSGKKIEIQIMPPDEEVLAVDPATPIAETAVSAAALEEEDEGEEIMEDAEE